MSLLETQELLMLAREEKRGETPHRTRVSVAAWFPFLFKDRDNDPHPHRRVNDTNLGIDSMGIFVFTYGKDETAQAAKVTPCIGLDKFNSHLTKR